jgi:hypothetical protein
MSRPGVRMVSASAPAIGAVTVGTVLRDTAWLGGIGNERGNGQLLVDTERQAEIGDSAVVIAFQ